MTTSNHKYLRDFVNGLPYWVRIVLGIMGVVWAFVALTISMIYTGIMTWFMRLRGIDVYDSHIQTVTGCTGAWVWPAFGLFGGCSLKVHQPDGDFNKPGLNIILCDHPSNFAETPIAWISAWRVWRYMVGSFDAIQAKFLPHAIAMVNAGMAITIDRSYKKQRAKLGEAAYKARGEEVDRQFRERIAFFHDLAKRLNICVSIVVFPNSRWQPKRHEDDLVKYGGLYPDIHNWGKHTLMPNVGGVQACREVLQGDARWYTMVMTTSRPHSDGSISSIMGTSYNVVFRDVTDVVNNLPMERDATANWLGTWLGPYYAQMHEIARINATR